MNTIIKSLSLLIVFFTIIYMNGCMKESINEPVIENLILTDSSAYYVGDDLSVSIGTGINVATLIDSLIIPPQPINSIVPSYPEEARRNNIQGQVWVKMLVMKNGMVKRVSILSSTNILFNRPTMTAAIRWTFKPGTYLNQPINLSVTIPFKYKLNGA